MPFTGDYLKSIQNFAAVLSHCSKLSDPSLFYFRSETCLQVIVIKHLIFFSLEWRHTPFEKRDWTRRKRPRENEDLSSGMSDDGLL